MNSEEPFKAVEWRDDKIRLLDQRLLPHAVKYVEPGNCTAVANAITDMVVRGAPAIGIAAAYAVVLAVRDALQRSGTNWFDDINKQLQFLRAARPTAVNLNWAVDQMQARAEEIKHQEIEVIEGLLLETALNIQQQDIDANKTMGDTGAKILGDDVAVLTHCNAGALATGGYGTALGVIRSGVAKGVITKVYADETRPWLQGSRLTAWELQQSGIETTLIADSAAAWLMQQGKIDWVIVGADRIAANGDVANKIGTYSLAVNAKAHNVKIMVAAPTSTIDLSIKTGKEIEIEEREENELLHLSDRSLAPAEVNAWNPVFDVTPRALIDVIVTEKGVFAGADCICE